MYINPFIAGVFVEMAIYVCRDVSRKSRNKQIYKRQNV